MAKKPAPIKPYPGVEKQFQLSNQGTRRQLRDALIHEFLKEEPGTGTGELCAKYRYFVETLADGSRVYLDRPARLNKGFDFVVNVEGRNFAQEGKRRRTFPSHNDIGRDMEAKKQENPQLYPELYALIKRVHDCEEVVPSEYAHMNFKTGFSVDLIVTVAKWLFIEQDMTYWNFSGRDKTIDAIPLP